MKKILYNSIILLIVYALIFSSLTAQATESRSTFQWKETLKEIKNTQVKGPSAFTYSLTCLGDTTSFQMNSTQGVDSVAWDFGNPTSGENNYSDEFHPKHYYSVPGDYLVVLTAYFSGISETTSHTLSVFPAAQVNIGSDTAICSGAFINFNAGVGFASYLWHNGSTMQTFFTNAAATVWVLVTDVNGCTASDTVELAVDVMPNVFLGNDTTICSAQPLHLQPGNYATYLWQDDSSEPDFYVYEPGQYHVAVTNACGEDADTINVMVDPSPVFSLGADVAICVGNTVVLDPGAGFETYFWQNGSPFQTFTVSSTGLYWVLVSNNFDCTFADSVFITVEQPIQINLGNDITICEFETVVLNAGGNYATYQWNIPDSTSRTLTVSTSGEYWVHATNSCGLDGDTINVTVLPAPEISLGNDTAICNGAAITFNPGAGFASYLWSVPGIITPTFTTGTPGTYWVRVTDVNGCSNTDTVVLTLSYPPTIVLGNDFFVCKGAEVSLDAGDGFLTYEWSNGDENQTITVQVEESTKFWVDVTNYCGVGTDTIWVYNYAVPQVNAGMDIEICEGLGVTLTASGVGTFTWNNGVQQAVEFFPTQTQYYTATITDENGCTGVDSVLVTVSNLPDIALGDDQTICVGDTVTLDAGAGYENYMWTTGEPTQIINVTGGTFSVTVIDEMNCSASGSITITSNPLPQILSVDSIHDGQIIVDAIGNNPLTYQLNGGNDEDNGNFADLPTGYYVVTVINVYGCSVSTDTMYIVESSDIIIPNVFTPNNDGFNDKWELGGLEGFDGAIVKIFDRWGNIQAQYDISENSWDGTCNGVAVKPDTYWYIITFPDDTEPMMGWIHLKR